MVRPYVDFFKLGINHHLLFPAVFDDAEIHEQTLKIVARMDFLEVLDLFLVLDEPRLSREMELVRACGKEIIYNCPLFGLKPGLDPNSTDPEVHQRTLEAALPHLDAAVRVGATKLVVGSGPDPADPADRPAAKDGFCAFLSDLGQAAAQYDTTVLIEPFDRSIGKNLLIGPHTEAAEVIERVRRGGVENVGLILDQGHVALLDEDIHEALEIVAPYLYHVHVGSCVKRDPTDSFYGDMHPPWGYEGGECDVPDTVELFQAAFDVGYLAPGKRASLTFEMQPYPGLGAEESVDIFLDKLDEAWEIFASQVDELQERL